MGRFAKKLVGYCCIGMGYQGIKKTVKSNSMIKSGFYSGLAGLFITGAYKCLEDTAIVERLERLLAQENSDTAAKIKGLLSKRVPSLEQRTQIEGQYSSLQEFKKQIMKEKGYL